MSLDQFTRPDPFRYLTTRWSACCSRPETCDHVWCGVCADWRNDTGDGPSCAHSPRNN